MFAVQHVSDLPLSLAVCSRRSLRWKPQSNYPFGHIIQIHAAVMVSAQSADRSCWLGGQWTSESTVRRWTGQHLKQIISSKHSQRRFVTILWINRVSNSNWNFNGTIHFAKMISVPCLLLICHYFLFLRKFHEGKRFEKLLKSSGKHCDISLNFRFCLLLSRL